MWSKVKAILGSVRFWQLVVIAALQVLLGLGYLTGDAVEAITKAVQLVLSGSVVIGSVDSAASRISGSK